MINDAMLLILISLTTWRISNMFAREAMMSRIYVLLKLNGGIRDFLYCVWCVSIPIAILLSLLFCDTIYKLVLFSMASSAVAILIDEKLIIGAN